MRLFLSLSISMEHSLKPSIIGILSETVSCAPAPVQYAALKAYDYTLALDSYLAHQRRILAALAAFVYGQLADSGYHVHMPSGGFYMYPDLTAKAAALAERGLYSSKDLSEDLLKSATVAVLPGSAFGAPDDRFTFRLSYVDFDGDAALKASQALGLETPIDLAFLERFCPKVLSGARLLAAYADKL
jgi:aspartate aminotransferase